MRILVTGTHGQLASSLVEVAECIPDITVITAGRPALDLLDPLSVRQAIFSARPDVVVSAAAYTAVDRAEDEQDLAYRVNVDGAACVAETTAALGIPVIHISTDYVFSGASSKPYLEEDEADPKTVYGYTKLLGEQAVAGLNPRHIILRTSWVYSPFGTNFVKTMLRVALERRTISVVSDQWGNPTCALDLAAAILHAAKHPACERPGIYHLAGTGDTNWSGFARQIFLASKTDGGPIADVLDIASAEYRTKAKRPLNSRLSCEKFAQTFGWRAPAWQDSARAVVLRILADGYPSYAPIAIDRPGA
jgi:dTDP-4-dehydrorhamnose reductase